MPANIGIAISTTSILLVPYESSHVPTYHEWMQEPAIQEATASEPLSIDEEYEMQQSWRQDHDKLTFIACLPIPSHPNTNPDAPPSEGTKIQAGAHDGPERMIGDVNLFLSQSDEDEEGCIGELELMIAPLSARRRGYGRATIIMFLHYIQTHLLSILSEYKSKLGSGVEKMRHLQLRVKIGSRNNKSIALFESLGFMKVAESPNYFGEFELVLEGFLGEERTQRLLESWKLEGYKEVEYVTQGE